ncbi:hypothetical protein IFM89_021340 [Coptis chinensis]|uniref:Uncharacterized protein n=1 Tax=Coptis chinensis TaxID=261450 RepID=A0A835IBC8_9MAGN|nr:hypothetical protein IFM89_021340 [Coptis chinensis]
MSSSSSYAKRGRGRSVAKKKEEIAEDYCFVCKDGGLLLVCDFKHCIKSYHPDCVGKDDTFVETGRRWVCGRHTCFICKKKSALDCFCCTSAVCNRCIKAAEFVQVRGRRGFCANCLNLVLLIEENVDVDSDGGKIDFKDRDTYECLFKEYWELIIEKEGLTLEDLRSANIRLKKGDCFDNVSDSDNFVEGEEEYQDFDDNMDGVMDIEPCSLLGKEPKLLSARNDKRKVKPKREYIGWGSKSLVEFLQFIGKDTSKPFSQYEVDEFIKTYIHEKKLQSVKKKVLFDSKLQSLFGRKSANRNKIFELLECHFAENLEESEEEDWMYKSDEEEDVTPRTWKRQKRTSLSRTDEKEKVLETPRSCFAAVITRNIKLVYLTRSLVEDLLKDPDTFHDKVMGSFVRVKSDPNDYFQKNLYQLLEVTGINKMQGTNDISQEVTLKLSNIKKDTRICTLSDEDFSEEEIEDLRQRFKDGLLKRLTIVELEEKARRLHESLTKHRRQLLDAPSELERLLQEVPKVIAEEIELEVTSMDLPKGESLGKDNSPKSIFLPKDATIDDRAGSDDAITVNANTKVPDSLGIEVNASNEVPDFSGVIVVIDDADEKAEAVKGIQDAISVNANTEVADFSGIKVVDDADEKSAENIIKVTGAAFVTEKALEMQVDGSRETNVFVVDENGEDDADRKAAEEGTKVNRDGAFVSTSSVTEKALEVRVDSNRETNVFVLDENEKDVAEENTDEKAVKVPGAGLEVSNVFVAGTQVESVRETQVVLFENEGHQGPPPVLIDLDNDEDENPESEIWHYVDPSGIPRGPFTMSKLRKWDSQEFFYPNFKVWKAGQSQEEAIFLEDALRRIYS